MKIEAVVIGLLACMISPSNAQGHPATNGASADDRNTPDGVLQVAGIEQPQNQDGSPVPKRKKWRLSKAEKAAEKQEQARQALLDATDMLFLGALSSGKSIVVTTTINLDSKYVGPDAVTENNAMYVTSKSGMFITDLTSTSEWKNTQVSGATFKVGNEAQAEKIGLEGSFYRFASGGTLYQVYIVEPGVYSLSGSSYEVRRMKAPPIGGGSPAGKPGLGRVTFLETKNSEYERGQEWRGEQYTTETVQSSYCNLVIAGSDQCVSWGTRTDEVPRQTRAAGYYPTIEEYKVDGVTAVARLSKNFASFTVGPGEAVLVDGLFAAYPVMNFDEGSCQRIDANKVDCEITDYALTRMPASIEEVRKNNPAARGYPRLAQVLSTIQYRPLDILAKPEPSKTEGAQSYVLSAGE
jgi:hypothetical protein